MLWLIEEQRPQDLRLYIEGRDERKASQIEAMGEFSITLDLLNFVTHALIAYAGSTNVRYVKDMR